MINATAEEEVIEDLILKRSCSTTDICSQINLISSIQYQQYELSKLAKLLQSEKDREKYIKVIEMSKIVQTKLDDLLDEKKKSNITLDSSNDNSRRVNSFGQHLDKKNSMWSLNNYYYNNSNSCRSSTVSSGYYSSGGSSQASENTLATSHHSSSINRCSSSIYKNNNEEQETFYYTDSNSLPQQQSTPSRYHNYNGHTYRVIDRVTSLQFQQGVDSVYNSRRPSADTILVDLCLKKEQDKVYVKPTLQRKKSTLSKQRSFIAASPAPAVPALTNSNRNSLITATSSNRDSFTTTTTTNSNRNSIVTIASSIEDEESVIMPTTAIHVAVRQNASLFKIEKSASKAHKEEQQKSLNAAVTTANKTITPKDALTTFFPPIPPQYLLSQQQINIEKKRVSFSEEKAKSIIKKKSSLQFAANNNGLFTPPDSPQSLQNQFVSGDNREISSETYLDLNNLPSMIHVQKKAHSSLQGLLKRTYQLNQYTITKTNSISLPFSTGILYKTCNPTNNQSKLLLKLVIVSLDIHSTEKQRRFGFTFYWQNHHTLYTEERPQHEDASKFALAPDSLVKEALVTWIESQNEGVALLPILSQSDEILRDGRKIYIVYDTKLFIS